MPPVRRALTYDVDDRLERAENRTQNLRILLAQVFVQYDAEMAHQLLLLAGQHDHRDAGDEIGRLLAHFRRLVVEAPEHGTANLCAGKKTKNAFFFKMVTAFLRRFSKNNKSPSVMRACEERNKRNKARRGNPWSSHCVDT